MVTRTNLLEAVEEPEQLQTSLKPTEVNLVTLPYIQGTLERFARTLNNFNINAAHKPVMTVGPIEKIKRTKDKRSKDLSTAVIYNINCKDCDKVYTLN